MEVLIIQLQLSPSFSIHFSLKLEKSYKQNISFDTLQQDSNHWLCFI